MEIVATGAVAFLALAMGFFFSGEVGLILGFVFFFSFGLSLALALVRGDFLIAMTVVFD